MLNTKEKAVISGFLIAILTSLTGFSGRCEQISEKLLRLHVIANSDSDEDQALKLKVRDRILEKSSPFFKSAKGLCDAERSASENLELIKEEAQKEIAENGFDYPVKVEIKNVYFNTRRYNEVTLPAGKYDAVRVTIGEGKGKNWWCVMFPPMCLPAAEEKRELEDVLNEEQMDLVEGGQKYEFKFKIVEIFEKIKEWIESVVNFFF